MKENTGPGSGPGDLNPVTYAPMKPKLQGRVRQGAAATEKGR